MTALNLDQTLVDSLYALAEVQDLPELGIAAQLVDLAWHRAQADQDLRHRWQTLTYRQQQIALLIHAGNTYPKIAKALTVGVETIRTQARVVYKKMGVSSKKELRALMTHTEVLNEYLENYKTASRTKNPP